ncbi:hypothetical protein B0T09DRAFT_384853 [Sordaria sp. MPI-SDFR-AT-0083]|nr:hypothetical protein B0T09DRAFT_384853 [Sordaria sp. MPI-SDFR-AT-0083]
MCTEYVYITKCWNCGVEHGAITTRCEKCDNATRHNQRWGAVAESDDGGDDDDDDGGGE